MHALESRTLEGHTSTARTSQSSHDCFGNASIKLKSSKTGTLEIRSSEAQTLQTHPSEIPVV